MSERIYASVSGDTVSNVYIGGGRADDIDVTDMAPRPAPGWGYVDGVFVAPPLPEVPNVADAPRIITRRALRARFTISELVAIEIASLDDPVAIIEARQTAATLRVLLATLNSAEFIDLDFPDARLGVEMIGQFGLLSPERVTEVLDAAVEDTERP